MNQSGQEPPGLDALPDKPTQQDGPIRFFLSISLLFAIACFSGGGSLGAGEIEFEEREALEETVSNDGSVQLGWNAGDGVEVELEQARQEDFSDTWTRYRGTDTASALTGLEEGVHYFRVRALGTEEWSEPIRIEVEFLSRAYLFTLLGLGGAVVLVTVGTILVGFFRTANTANTAEGGDS